MIAPVVDAQVVPVDVQVMQVVAQSMPQQQQAMMVQIPHGAEPGKPFGVQTPAGNMMVECPAGSKPGDSIQIMVPVVATAAATPMVSPSTSHPAAYSTYGHNADPQGTGHWVDKAAIVAKVRAGQCIHGEQEAVPYANACEFNPAAMTGCYCIKCGSKSGIPVGLTYNFFLGPWFCFQPCLPLPLWCGCSDEREGNVYINRGRQGRGTVMVIDEEMGTLACYHCEEEASPCCTCVKIGK